MFRFLKPDWLKKYSMIRKESGWKGVFKQGGAKLIIGIFLFYLVRDTILYGIPLLLWLLGSKSCSA
jgi:hypothetical protein|tara:strand:+ start:736 stop:933 length:198 start_codon:yes stop_codon:yes gene_type:complete